MVQCYVKNMSRSAKKNSIAKIPGIKMSNSSEAIHGSKIVKIKSGAFSKKKPLQNMMTKFFKGSKDSYYYQPPGGGRLFDMKVVSTCINVFLQTYYV